MFSILTPHCLLGFHCLPYIDFPSPSTSHRSCESKTHMRMSRAPVGKWDSPGRSRSTQGLQRDFVLFQKSQRQVPALEVPHREGKANNPGFGAENFSPGSFPRWIFLWHQLMEKGWGNNNSCLEKQVLWGSTSKKKRIYWQKFAYWTTWLGQKKKKKEEKGILQNSCHSHEHPNGFQERKRGVLPGWEVRRDRVGVRSAVKAANPGRGAGEAGRCPRC